MNTPKRRRKTLTAAGIAAITFVGLAIIGSVAAGGLTVTANESAAGAVVQGTCLADDSVITVDPIFANGDTTQFSQARVRVTSPTSPPTCAGGSVTFYPWAADAMGSAFLGLTDGDIDVVVPLSTMPPDGSTVWVPTDEFTKFTLQFSGGTAQ